MKVDDIVKMTLGDLIVKNAILQEKVAELEAKLAEANDKMGKTE